MVMNSILLELALSFGVAFAVSVACTPCVRFFAERTGVVDHPTSARKIHTTPIALLGGLAIFFAIILAGVVAIRLGFLPGIFIREKYLIGICVATAVLIIGGYLDDRYTLRPWQLIITPSLATLVIIASGIGIRTITNPFGGLLDLRVWAGLFTFVWLMTMTYTTKLLDGVDGLVSGITVIGAIIIAAVSLRTEVFQPDTAVLAIILAGAFLGFLVCNFHPASIFLGESGSTLAGFLLGVLAIIAGGKIATTLLILGLPLFDAVVVILRRIFKARILPSGGDASHLHFRLLRRGWSQRQTALFYYLVAGLFGVSTLFLRGIEKSIAIVLLLVLLMGLLVYAA